VAPIYLRHAFASLLAHEGRSVGYIAEQLGHGPELSLKTYQHVIDEFEDAPRLAAEDAIRQAREQRQPLRKV
jgi:integrase